MLKKETSKGSLKKVIPVFLTKAAINGTNKRFDNQYIIKTVA